MDPGYEVLPTELPLYQNTVKLKVLSIFVLLFVALVGGAIPLYLVRDGHEDSARTHRRRRRINRAVSIMNSFSGGVFLSIALVHLLPSVRNLITDALASHDESGVTAYPWAELLASTGFFLIVMIEQVMIGLEERFGSSSHGNPDISILFHAHGHGGDNAHGHGDTAEIPPTPRENDASNGEVDNNMKEKEVEALEDGEHTKLEVEGSKGQSSPRKNDTALVILNAFVLLTALSVHSLLEGLALGLQLTRTATLDLLIALSLHKGIEAFTISLSFVQTPASRLVKWATFVVFSLTSPIGIAIGIPITSEENAESPTMLMANGVMQGLATGTFMYVTFIELLPLELKARGDRMIKFAVMLVGFGIIAAVTSLEFSK